MAEMKGAQSTFPSANRELLSRFEQEIPSAVGVIEGMAARLSELLNRTFCRDDTDSLELAFREALANAIIHGNGCDPGKMVRVCIAITSNCEVHISVTDTGPGFDLDTIPDPRAKQNLLDDHGRGIFLIRSLMDEVRFSFDLGTTIHMRRILARRT